MIINQEDNEFPSVVEVKDDEISSLSVINQEDNKLSSLEMKDDDVFSFRERRIKRRIAFFASKVKKSDELSLFTRILSKAKRRRAVSFVSTRILSSKANFS